MVTLILHVTVVKNTCVYCHGPEKLIFAHNKHPMSVALNVRHLAWYRFTVGCLVFLDVTNRLLNWDTYYTGSGILGQHILNREEGSFFEEWAPGMFGLVPERYHYSLLIFGLTQVLFYMFMNHWLNKVFVWFLVTSIHSRNPFLVHYADKFLSVLLFTNIFLDFGDASTTQTLMMTRDMSSKRKKLNADSHSDFCPGHVLYIVQLSCLYLSTSVDKFCGEQWVKRGTALHTAYLDAPPTYIRYPFGELVKALLAYSVETAKVEGSDTDFMYVAPKFIRSFIPFLCYTVVFSELLIGIVLLFTVITNKRHSTVYLSWAAKYGMVFQSVLLLTFDFGITFHLVFLSSFIPILDVKFRPYSYQAIDTRKSWKSVFSKSTWKQFCGFLQKVVIYGVCFLTVAIVALRVALMLVPPQAQGVMQNSRDSLVAISNFLHLRSHSWNMYSPDPPSRFVAAKVYFGNEFDVNRVGTYNNSVQLYSRNPYWRMMVTHLDSICFVNRAFAKPYIHEHCRNGILRSVGAYMCKKHFGEKIRSISQITYKLKILVTVHNASKVWKHYTLLEMACSQLEKIYV